LDPRRRAVAVTGIRGKPTYRAPTEVLPEVKERARTIRRRRATVAAGAFTAAIGLAVAAAVVVSQSTPETEVATRGDLGIAKVTSGVETTTLTSTTSVPDQVSSAAPSTRIEVSGSESVSRTEDGLAVTLTMSVPAAHGRPTRIVIDVFDERGGVIATGIDWGDGTSAAIPSSPGCPSDSPSAASPRQSDASHPAEHTFATAGEYRISAYVTSTRCPSGSHSMSVTYLLKVL
jgi:hypothetical protein